MATKIKNAFVHSALIKNIEKKTSKKDKAIEVYSRSTTILPSFVSKSFKI